MVYRPGQQCWPDEPVGSDEELAEIAEMFGSPPRTLKAQLGAKRRPVSRQASRCDGLIDDLRAVAEQLLFDLRCQDDDPRLASVVERLEEIESLANRLDTLLASADDYTLDALDFGSGLSDARRAVTDVRDERGAATNPLRELAMAAAGAKQDLLETYGKDRGGRGNLFTLSAGPARRQFARACADLFLDHNKPDELTGTEGGRFYLIVTELWSYATGRDPEGDALGATVKTVAPAMRDLQALADQIDDNMLLLADLQASAALPHFIQEAVERGMMLRARRDALWEQIGTGRPKLVTG